MTAALLVAWFASGLTGFAMCRLSVCGSLRETFCPSPFIIVIALIVSIGGLMVVFGAMMVALCDFLDWVSKQDTWFTRSICRKDRR